MSPTATTPATTVRERRASDALTILWHAHDPLTRDVALAALSLLGHAAPAAFGMNAPSWNAWAETIAKHAWRPEEADTIAAAALAADPPRDVLAQLASAPHPNLPAALHRHQQHTTYPLTLALALCFNPALTEPERDAVLTDLVTHRRAHLKYHLSGSFDGPPRGGAVSRKLALTLAQLAGGPLDWVWRTEHASDADVIEVATRRVTSTPIERARDLAPFLRLLHPQAATTPRKRRRLRAHLHRALKTPLDQATQSAVRLALAVGDGSADPLKMRTDDRKAWLQACAAVGTDAFDAAVDLLAAADRDDTSRAFHLGAVKHVLHVPAPVVPGSRLYTALEALDDERLSTLLGRVSSFGVLSPSPAAVAAAKLLLERAMSGSASAFLKLSSTSTHGLVDTRDVPDEVVAAMPWNLVRSVRPHLLAPVVTQAAVLGGPSAVELVLSLEWQHTGTVAELADAITASLS